MKTKLFFQNIFLLKMLKGSLSKSHMASLHITTLNTFSASFYPQTVFSVWFYSSPIYSNELSFSIQPTTPPPNFNKRYCSLSFHLYVFSPSHYQFSFRTKILKYQLSTPSETSHTRLVVLADTIKINQENNQPKLEKTTNILEVFFNTLKISNLTSKLPLQCKQIHTTLQRCNGPRHTQDQHCDILHIVGLQQPILITLNL